MAEPPPIEGDLYNKEDDFIRRILSIYTDLVIPSKIDAQLNPNGDTIKNYSVALDSIVAMLELTLRLTDVDLDKLHKEYNTAIEDCVSADKRTISATPLRGFEYKLSRIIAQKKFFERTYDSEDEVKDALGKE